jgi:hypothetical protein
VRSELRLVLTDSGFNVCECSVIEEDFRPELLVATRATNGNMASKLWRHKLGLGVAALGSVWSALGLPFGRILWAVGQKPTVNE